MAHSNRVKVIYLVLLTVLICLMAGGVAFFGMAASHSKEKDEQIAQLEQEAVQRESEKAELEKQVQEKESQISSMEQKITELNQQLVAKKNLEKQKEKEEKKKAQESGSIQGGGNEQGKVCYLTFDDGPSTNTLSILDVLKRENVKATFFVIHSSHTDYLKRIAADGHAIGLHSYCHKYSQIYSTETGYFEDLQKISHEVEQAIGYAPKIMRFPGGSSNTVSQKYNKGIMTRLAKQVQDRGYVYFDWNCDSGDASGNKMAVAKLVDSVKRGAGKKQVINVLMHDTAAKSTTVQALPQIISYLRSQGYEFRALTTESKPIHQKINN